MRLTPMITNLMRRIHSQPRLSELVVQLQALRSERLNTAKTTPTKQPRAKKTSVDKAAKLLSNLPPEQLKALAKTLKES